MWNPLCCFTPRIGVFIFAILDLITAIPFVWDSVNYFLNNAFRTEVLINLVLSIALLVMGLLLLAGAIQESQLYMHRWLMMWTAFVIFWIIFRLFQVATVKFDWRMGGGLASILLYLYEAWVVYAYLIELERGKGGLTYCPYTRLV